MTIYLFIVKYTKIKFFNKISNWYNTVSIEYFEIHMAVGGDNGWQSWLLVLVSINDVIYIAKGVVVDSSWQ